MTKNETPSRRSNDIVLDNCTDLPRLEKRRSISQTNKPLGADSKLLFLVLPANAITGGQAEKLSQTHCVEYREE